MCYIDLGSKAANGEMAYSVREMYTESTLAISFKGMSFQQVAE